MNIENLLVIWGVQMLNDSKKNMDFGGNVIAVLGGSGLLGSAVVESLVDFNASPLIIDIDAKAGKKLREKIIERGYKAHFHLADFSQTKEIPKLVSEIEELYGNIAGWALCFYPRTKDWGNKIEEVSPKSWSDNVEMHMNATCLSSSEIAKSMANQRGGSIVTIGSIYGLIAPSFEIYEGTDMTTPAAYSAIKGGIISFTKYLASYYGSNNVRVNCVVPGGIFDNQSESFLHHYSSRTCLKRLAKPEEVASAIIYLLSDASSYITGVSLPVDGGYLAL